VNEYILDTSAVRGFSKADLEAAAERWRLSISPLSIYEILCHLDEPSSKHGSLKAVRSPPRLRSR
jgi:predicted nucleic acid-binding protein